MNETWGPPIKNRFGRVLEPASPSISGHPSTINNLSPQYSVRKRQSEDAAPAPQPEGSSRYTVRKRQSGSPPKEARPDKKLKKQHKRYTAPTFEEMASATSNSSSILSSSSSPVGTDERCPDVETPVQPRRRIVLLPPKPELPDGHSCARCGGEAGSEGLYACKLCCRKAFCGTVCQVKNKQSFCSQRCRRQQSIKADSRDSGISPKTTSPTDGSGSLDDAHDSPSERKEQKAKQRRFEKKCDEARLQQGRENCRIMAYRIAPTGRSIDYQVHYQSSSRRERRWVAATCLQGKDWTQKIEEFWKSSQESRRDRMCLELPEGVDRPEPGPFEIRVLNADFSNGRDLCFDVRYFESLEPGEQRFTMAEDLSSAFDDAIEDY